jgi:hypothetical protein
MVTIEATVSDNGRAAEESATDDDESAPDGSLAAAGVAADSGATGNTA